LDVERWAFDVFFKSHFTDMIVDPTMKFHIRLATLADADTIARHRARMFQDMGDLPPDLFEPFRVKSRELLHDLLARNEYIGWLASPENNANNIIAGAGVQLRQVLPHPSTNPDGTATVASGRHAIILNVFTEPEWRRRRIAALLMKRIIDWSREEKLDRLVLHAAQDSRPLYERLGFVATTEMKFAGEKPL
jgi:GNAT superfamily N-acetyltransferase